MPSPLTSQATFARYNDGSQNPPRLRLQFALWGLEKLPMNAPEAARWTLDEKFARLKGAGFEAVECWLTDDNEAETKAALDRHGLRLVLGHRPFTPADIDATVARAVRLRADFVFAQPADAFTPLETVAELVRYGQNAAAKHGLPFFVETHRNNFTETIGQTVALLNAVPDVGITGDLSHFVVVGEFYGWESERADHRMMPVLAKVSHLHGRVSSGEAVQVDVGDGSGQSAQFFVSLWRTAMGHWLKGAKPGDVFPFAPELGPPRYALTLPDGSEFSDRWEQGLVMANLARQAWREAGGG